MDIPDKSKPAEEPKKAPPVIPQGGAERVKRPARKRIMNFVIAENPKELAKDVGRNLVVPRLKASFEEAFNSLLAGLLWGNSANRPTNGIVRGTVLNPNTTVYGGVVNGGVSPQQLAAAAMPNRPSGYQDVKVPTQQYAEALLARLYQDLNEYRMVSIADLYEAANLPTEPQDHKMGWYSLEGAHVEIVRDGFVLALPRPTRL